MKTLNANNLPITPAIVDLALANSGLTWAMSRAQERAIEIHALQSSVELTLEKPTGVDFDRIKATFPPIARMCGIPVVVDQTIEDGVIELRSDDGRVLGRIQGLAIPYGMERL